MNHAYDAFGVHLRSNRPLPGLREAEPDRPDLTVEFAGGREPDVDATAALATTATRGSNSTRVAPDGGRLFLLASHGGERVWSMRVDGDGARIEVRWRGPVALADIAALVITTGLPAALRLRGVPLLHGAAVASGGAAFAVLGESGAGKSSIAAAAVAGGYALLADDVLALHGDPSAVRVHPGGWQLRMNEDTALAFGWEPWQLTRVYATPELPPKLFARARVDEPGARRLAAVFVLGPRHRSEHGIVRLEPAAALPLLLAHGYLDSIDTPPERAALLPFWVRLARELPVHAIAPPDGLADLPAFVSTLAEAAAMLPPPCAPQSSSSGRRAP